MSYAKDKTVSRVIFCCTCLFIKCASLFYSKYVVFHKLDKTYSFAYAKLYVLQKYRPMFLHMHKYIPCTKHIVCICKIYSFANVYGFARSNDNGKTDVQPPWVY